MKETKLQYLKGQGSLTHMYNIFYLSDTSPFNFYYSFTVKCLVIPKTDYCDTDNNSIINRDELIIDSEHTSSFYHSRYHNFIMNHITNFNIVQYLMFVYMPLLKYDW
jgi:hypothetical protein